MQIKLTWARQGSDFTLLFESFAMVLMMEMPVNPVAKPIDVGDNELWRMVLYYVHKAREYEDYSSVESIGIDETTRQIMQYLSAKQSNTGSESEGKGIQDF